MSGDVKFDIKSTTVVVLCDSSNTNAATELEQGAPDSDQASAAPNPEALKQLLKSIFRQGVGRVILALKGCGICSVEECGVGYGVSALCEHLKINSESELWKVLSLRLGAADSNETLAYISSRAEFIPNIGSILRVHTTASAHLTLCVKQVSYDLPITLLRVDDNDRLVSCESNPMYSDIVDLGVYVLSIPVLRLAAASSVNSMPKLISLVQSKLGEPNLYYC